ncbi:hypothetical protein K0M31_005293 [Melipona bicolor]|uniref:Uncharacterized protein n=1 Tax=Melipona bicolor TaxID=60889 RepID=A0AA40KMC3_9HYME|nr:hypothetical protein K0M31_005293 [Melipona bicolor]
MKNSSALKRSVPIHLRPVAHCGLLDRSITLVTRYGARLPEPEFVRSSTGSVCLSARQGLGNVSLPFRLLTLTDVRIGPIERFDEDSREIGRFWGFIVALVHLLASATGGRNQIVDYNTGIM